MTRRGFHFIAIGLVALLVAIGGYFIRPAKKTTTPLPTPQPVKEAPNPQLAVQVGHTGQILCVAFSPDGKFVASGDSLGLIILWDVAAGSEIREFVGHTGPVNALAFTSDGRYLVTGSGDQEAENERLARLDASVRIWDVLSGAELHRFTHHADPVTSVQFSRDNQKILTASLDGVAKIVEIKTGNVLQTLGSATLPVNVARFSPDGNFVVLARGANDEQSLSRNRGKFGVQVWEIATSKLSFELGAERNLIKSPVGYLSFSSDGHYLATSGKNPIISDSALEGIRLWDFEKRQLLKTWRADSEVNQRFYGPVSFSAAGTNRLIAGGFTSTIDADAFAAFQLNVEDGTSIRFRNSEELKAQAFESGITTALDVSADQKLVVVATNAQAGGGTNGEETGETLLRIFELENQTQVRELTGSKTRLSEIQLSPDGRILSTFRERSWPHPILNPAGGYIWDTKVGAQINLSSGGSRSSGELLLAVSSDGALAITQSGKRSTLWDVGTQNIIKTLPPAQGAWFSADHSRLLTWNALDASDTESSAADMSNTRISLWETRNGGRLWDYEFERGGGSMAYERDVGRTPIHFDCALSPDAKFVAINPGIVTLLDGRTGEAITDLAFTETNRDNGLLTFSPDSKYLLIGMPEELVAVNVNSGRQRWRFGLRVTSELNFASSYLVFSSDGKYVAVAGVVFPRDDSSTDKIKDVIKIIEVDSGKEYWELHDQSNDALAFSSDSRELVTVDFTGLKLYLWDVQSRTLIKTISGAVNDRILSVGFGKDSQIIMTGGVGGKVRLIDKKSDSELCTLVSFSDGTWVVVTKDGRFDTNNLEAIQGLHWVFPEEPMKLLPLEIFLRQYYEPQLFLKILQNKELPTIPPVGSLNRTQPKFAITKITDPDPEGHVYVTVSASSAVSAGQTDENGKLLESGIFDVRLFRDGQLVGYSTPVSASTDARDELVNWRNLNRIPLSEGRYEQTFLVQLPHRADLKEVEFSSYGFNSDRVKSETARAVLTLKNPLVSRQGRAYVISIGVNACETERWDLSFAANDARVVKNELTSALRATQYFENVVGVSLVSDYASIDDSLNELRVKHKVSPRTITEASATKQNLKQVFERLAGKPKTESVNVRDVDALGAVSPDDLLVIYFSGHGYTDTRGNFYLVPYDVGQVPYDVGQVSEQNFSDDVLGRFVSSNELSEWIKDIDAGEIVLLLDTCYAAAAVESGGFKPAPLGSRGLGQLAYDKGMRILVASQVKERALDSGDLKQGLLTYCLIQEGIKASQADYKPRNKVITLDEWLTFAVIRVPKVLDELTRGYVQTVRNNAKRVVVIGEFKSAASPTDTSQQASLFDFKRKKLPVNVAHVSAR